MRCGLGLSWVSLARKYYKVNNILIRLVSRLCFVSNRPRIALKPNRRGTADSSLSFIEQGSGWERVARNDTVSPIPLCLPVLSRFELPANRPRPNRRETADSSLFFIEQGSGWSCSLGMTARGELAARNDTVFRIQNQGMISPPRGSEIIASRHDSNGCAGCDARICSKVGLGPLSGALGRCGRGSGRRRPVLLRFEGAGCIWLCGRCARRSRF